MKKFSKQLTAIVLFLGIQFVAHSQSSNMNKFSLVIHGGAGTITKENMTPELEAQYKQKMEEALKAGYDKLAAGGEAMDAVIAAINVMEDSPLFNAGKGAVFSNEGRNEMDASVMDGKTGKAGAVAGVHRIKNPINGARAVMDKSAHVLLTGNGADLFAKEQGLEIVEPSYFRDEKRWKQLEQIRKKDKTVLDHSDTSGFVEPSEEEFRGAKDGFEGKKFGTVGCVALDKNGNIAAGTSTGGMTNKKWNRVGDSPIIGAGTFARNSTCGISATGHGEFFIRNVVAYDISALMEYKNMPLEDAAREVIMNKLKSQGGEGGVIGMDAQGNITMIFNTPGMYRGYIKEGEKPWTGIYGSDR